MTEWLWGLGYFGVGLVVAAILVYKAQMLRLQRREHWFWTDDPSNGIPTILLWPGVLVFTFVFVVLEYPKILAQRRVRELEEAEQAARERESNTQDAMHEVEQYLEGR